jgi:opacity protein-like surface antigen
MKAAALLLAALATPPALAWENWKSRFTDGPSAAWLTGGDFEEDRFAYGWQAGYDVIPWASLELAYLYFEDEISPATLSPLGLPAGSKVNLDNHTFGLSARLHFLRRETWSLYAGGGVTYTVFSEEDAPVNAAIARTGSRDPSDASFRVRDSFTPHLLAGAEVSLSRHWEVFAEVRPAFGEHELETRIITTAPDGTRAARSLTADLPYAHTALRLGVNYRF